jgi:PKD domain
MMRGSHKGSFTIIVPLIFIIIFSSTIVPSLPFVIPPSPSLSAIKEAAAQEQEGEGETSEAEEGGETTTEHESPSLQQEAEEEQSAAAAGDDDSNNNNNNINHPPTADAGLDLTVDEGALGVTLSGRGVDEDPNDKITYLWKQIVEEEEQPEVKLNDADTAQATFDAPNNIEQDTTLTFELTVSDGKEESKDTVNVLVKDIVAAAETEEIATGEGQKVGGAEGEEKQNPESQTTQPSGEKALVDNTNADTTNSPTTSDSASNPSPTADVNTNTMNSGLEAGVQEEGVQEINAQSATASFTVTYDLEYGWESQIWVAYRHIKYSGTVQLELENDANSYKYVITSAEGQCELTQGPDDVPKIITYTARADLSAFWLNNDGTLHLQVGGITSNPEAQDQYCYWPPNEFSKLSYTIENGMIRSANSVPISCQGPGGGNDCTQHISWDISVPAPPEDNLPPTANAGQDQTVKTGDTVTLDGSSSTDPDGSITSYLWEQTAGEPVTLSDSSAVSPTFTAPSVTAQTTLTFKLTVTDNDGATGTDTVDVIVEAEENTPPPMCSALKADAIQKGVGCTPKIEVRASKIPGLAGKLQIYHLYIIHTDTDGLQYIFRAGPSLRNGPPFGHLETCYAVYKPGGKCGDWHPNAPSVTVAKDSQVNPLVLNCLHLERDRIQSMKVPYELTGPNSNSFVYTLLQKCALPAEKPVSEIQVPGWGMLI